GRGRGGLAVGGGIGGLLIVVVGLFFGVDLSGVTGGTDPGTTTPDTSSTLAAKCRTGADANTDDDCRLVGTVNSVQDYWAQALPAAGATYVPVNTVDYQGQTQSACGTASNAVGPFYCPTDKKVYIDTSFFAELTSRFGADDGALAQEYVVAHEYGHHVQDILGLLDNAQRDPQGATSGAVRTELQADCLAGMWANGAASTKDAQGRSLLKPLTEQDIASALSAASAVGDDRIQQKSQGGVNPEAWTHGSAEQRQRWFTTGYTKGSLQACDTFSARTL
ncbi:MAG: neutral zinc metallopeptidase, partial [Actinomycetota bacterium]